MTNEEIVIVNFLVLKMIDAFIKFEIFENYKNLVCEKRHENLLFTQVDVACIEF